jgi:hypothetical protein
MKDHVALTGDDGAMAGRRVVIPGRVNRLRVLVARLTPRRVSAAIALQLNRTQGATPRAARLGH